MKILIIYDGSGPKYHRLLTPMALMPGVELVVNHIVTEDLVKDIDILFFNRLVPNNSINNVISWRALYGFKIVVDFDDHWNLEPDHYLYTSYKLTRMPLFMKAWIEEADAVTVTHERLAQDVLPYNSNVHVLPNAIPKFGQFDTKKIESEYTRLFWAGGITHQKDIELLRYPLRLLKDLNIQMVLGGYSKNKVFYKIRNDFTNYGKLNHVLLEGLPVAEYYYMYSRCDISLIPLTDTKFNTHKSNLKILEAANIGANVVVSNVHPYKDIPFVNYVNEPDDWAKHVRWLINNPDEAKEQALQLQQYCSERFNFNNINKSRKQLFEKICGKKTENHSKSIEAITING